MKKAIILGLCLAGGVFAQAAQAEVRVVASIKPIHSLVSAVMGESGTPELIIDGVASPHSYALKPSQAQALQSADVVFWVGPDLEQFLVKSLKTAGQNARSVALINSDGLTLRPYRGPHNHDQGHHEDHDKHEHDKNEHAEHKHEHDEHKPEHEEHKNEHAEHKHEHDEHKHDEHKHEGHGHDHEGETDPHVWLDPENAQVMLRAIANVLSEKDPKTAATYQKNADKMIKTLDQVSSELSKMLAGARDLKYVVFHDAYQYFEARFGMEPVAAIALNPEVAPGAEQLRKIKHEISENKVVCAFSEPQFSPKLVKLVLEGSSAKFAQLDPLGSAIAKGDDHYILTIRQMAESFQGCLP